MAQNRIRSKHSRRIVPISPLYERMRKWDVGNGLEFRHCKDSKIGVPSMKSIQRVMITAEVLWETLPADRSLEHPAQRNTVHDAPVDAKPDDATCKLVHHHQNPVCSQSCRFAPKQVAAPQAVLRVAEEGEPGWIS